MTKKTPDPRTADDPVAEAARRVVRLVAAMNANEAEQFETNGAGDVGQRMRLEDQYRMLEDAFLASEEAISQRATSMAGAMAQLMLAHSDLALISSHVREERAGLVQPYCRRLERCLYSVLALLTEASGTDPAEVGGLYYGGMPEHNPHVAIERALLRAVGKPQAGKKGDRE